MKKFKLKGKVIRVIGHLPMADIEEENLEQAKQKYLEFYAEGNVEKGCLVSIEEWTEEEINDAIAKKILK